MALLVDISPNSFVMACARCGGKVDRSPRFRARGPTADLCWVCARMYHSVHEELKRESALWPKEE